MQTHYEPIERKTRGTPPRYANCALPAVRISYGSVARKPVDALRRYKDVEYDIQMNIPLKASSTTTAMHCWTRLNVFALCVILVFQRTPAAGRLVKRNGYNYRSAPSSPSHSVQYEPSSHSHEQPPSSPAHESGIYYDYKSQPSSQHSSPPHPPSSSGGNSKPGYSIGSGLRSIAQGSANQAYTAVASQHAAAKQAAFIAKNTLAQAASQAAATAQAALAGKRVILQELEQQAAEAHRSLSRELDQLKAAKVAGKLAQQTAQAAFQHVSVLTAAVNNAKSVAEQADQASGEVASQLASQAAMVGQAKNRLEQVEEQLKQARVDFAATQEAAIKAASSAAAAQVNASKAAAHATIGLHDNANQHTSDGDESYDDDQIETTATGHAEGEGEEQHSQP